MLLFGHPRQKNLEALPVCLIPLHFLLYSRNQLLSVIVLVWVVSMCVYKLSSPRHGWTGRVWSHARTIHEDRGGLPARLLSHWQRKVSDGFHHVQTHSYTLTSLFLSVCTPLFTVHSHIRFRPSSASKTINHAPYSHLLQLALPDPLAVVLFVIFFSVNNYSSILFYWINLFVHFSVYLKLEIAWITWISPLDLMVQKETVLCFECFSPHEGTK